jgi:hypothetical protein
VTRLRTHLVDVAPYLQMLSHSTVREGVLVEISSFGTCLIAEDSGDVCSVLTADLPSDNLSLGQRVQFQVTSGGQLSNFELVYD